MLPAFEIVHRLRPVALVAWERTTGFVAPYAAVETELGTHDVAGRVVAGFRGPGALRLEGWYDGGRRLAGVDVTDAAGRTTHHRSRRHGRPDTPPEAIATALTGRQLTVLTRNDGTWTARAKVDLTDLVATGDPEVLAGLEADTAWLPRAPGDRSPVTSWRAGTFGQLGVRDVGLVTEADGTPVERDGLPVPDDDARRPGLLRHRAHRGLVVRPGRRWRSSTAATSTCAATAWCSATTPSTWSATGTGGCWPAAPGATSTAPRWRSRWPPRPTTC